MLKPQGSNRIALVGFSSESSFLLIIIIMSIGVPIKLLHEAELHVVTVELKTGELYRGYLMEAEDTMNMRLDDVFVTKRDGKQLHFD